MAEKPATDPLDLLQLSRDLLATPQRFLPSTHIYTRIAEIMRDVAQAHATYVQELLRANAALLAAFMERPAAAENERPAEAVHRRDRDAS